jgi:hypothetical protein
MRHALARTAAEDPDGKVVVVEKDRVLAAAAEDDTDLVAASMLSWTI